MPFTDLAKQQYLGSRPFASEEEEQSFKKRLSDHHALLFAGSQYPDANVFYPPGDKVDLWNTLLAPYLRERVDFLKNNLARVAASVTEHKRQIVERIGTVLMGDKVAAVARGVYEGILAGQHIFLFGTAGVGKTTLVELLCRAMRIPYQRVDGQSDMADIHLMGAFLPVNGQLRWTPGPLLVPGNVVLLIDELPRIPASVSNILLQPMAERAMAFTDLMDGGMREVDLSPAFTVIGTGNPFHYGGMAQKNEAVFDRFGMGFDMPHPEHSARLQMMDSLDWNESKLLVEAAPVAPHAPVPAPHDLLQGIPGLTVGEDKRPLSMLEVKLAARMVEMDAEKKELLIRISEMVSPVEYRRRVGWLGTDSDDPRLARGPGMVDGVGQPKRLEHLRVFLERYDTLLEAVVQEGSNPRGEEMMAGVARISALANGRIKVEDEDVRVAAARCLRFRLKPFPGQDEFIPEIIRIASAFWTYDASISTPDDRSVSQSTRKQLGVEANDRMNGAIFGSIVEAD